MAEDKIEALYACLHDNTDGSEGLLAFNTLPVVTSRRATLEALRPRLRDFAARTNHQLHLVKFSVRKHVETILPERRFIDEFPVSSAGNRKPAGAIIEHDAATNQVRIGHTPFAEPVVGDASVAEGVVVYSTLVNGTPGVAFAFVVDGNELPPVAVSEHTAADIPKLVTDALDTARRQLNG